MATSNKCVPCRGFFLLWVVFAHVLLKVPADIWRHKRPQLQVDYHIKLDRRFQRTSFKSVEIIPTYVVGLLAFLLLCASVTGGKRNKKLQFGLNFIMYTTCSFFSRQIASLSSYNKKLIFSLPDRPVAQNKTRGSRISETSRLFERDAVSSSACGGNSSNSDTWPSAAKQKMLSAAVANSTSTQVHKVIVEL